MVEVVPKKILDTWKIIPYSGIMKTVSEIIADAGGPEQIAKALQGAITADGVRKWRQNGIPDRYWSKLRAITSVDVAVIFAANELARGVPPVASSLTSTPAVAAAEPSLSPPGEAPHG